MKRRTMLPHFERDEAGVHVSWAHPPWEPDRPGSGVWQLGMESDLYHAPAVLGLEQSGTDERYQRARVHLRVACRALQHFRTLLVRQGGETPRACWPAPRCAGPRRRGQNAAAAQALLAFGSSLLKERQKMGTTCVTSMTLYR